VVDQPVDHGDDDVVAEDFAPAKGSFEVTISQARSLREDTSWKNRFAASGSSGR
jgi:hypothetical protein